VDLTRRRLCDQGSLSIESDAGRVDPPLPEKPFR